ncbi:MAG: DUF1080 domain-containing protein [Gemmatimonadota bacterium]|nr:DUF1080 domain-containing protein [Gemmatimonadota bacterium]MDE2871818.1 DUF1080 domain-containing protein [Gemmatimonadota bacterium]
MRTLIAMTIPLLTWTGACGGRGGDGGADGGRVPGTREAREETAVEELTPEEEAAGWRLLFDGTLDAWRGYRREDAPAGWSAVDGTLAFTPGADGGTLITRERFGDFELALEWKVAEGGNSGVFYRATEAERAPYWTGPELQVLDNAGHPDGRVPETSAGANYALHAPVADVTRPAGEWNRVRIVVRGARVEHWMNRVKVVEYELWTDEWRAAVAATKFAEWPAYGMAEAGHIGLQDHGDPVWYRNIRIREF